TRVPLPLFAPTQRFFLTQAKNNPTRPHWLKMPATKPFSWAWDYVFELKRSIPKEEKEAIRRELTAPKVIARAQQLETELTHFKSLGIDWSDSREVFLAALRNVHLKKISVAQLASLHMLDSAKHALSSPLQVPECYHFSDAAKSDSAAD